MMERLSNGEWIDGGACESVWFVVDTNSSACKANTKHLFDICAMLDQRRRRWADVAQMLHKCFVFAG